jgi:anaerobic selenocysteine-containing dehydrogenase
MAGVDAVAKLDLGAAAHAIQPLSSPTDRASAQRAVPVFRNAYDLRQGAHDSQAHTSRRGGDSRYVKSTCVHCVNFCGNEVELENGVTRTVYPDKACAPYYNVGICPKGVASGFNTCTP